MFRHISGHFLQWLGLFLDCINWKHAERCCGQDYSEKDFSSFVSCQVLKQCIFISRIQWEHGCVLFTAFPRSLVLFPLTSLHQMYLQKRGWWLAGDAEDTLAFVGPFGSITRASGGTVKQCQTWNSLGRVVRDTDCTWGSLRCAIWFWVVVDE